MKNKILWLIPARAGSTSIPNKNIKMLGGLPLMHYRIITALAIASQKDVWISTDSQKYATIAEQAGATLPFIRPPELSTDRASSMDVVLHAMDHADKLGEKYDGIGLLEPTSPFIPAKILQSAINSLFADKDADAVVATKEMEPHSYFVQKDAKYLTEFYNRVNGENSFQRQNYSREITPSGGFYISKWDKFRKYRSFYTAKTLSFLLKEPYILEIDEPIHFMWAEFIMEKGIVTQEELFSIK